MFEQLRSKEAATISAVLALTLGIAACGGQESSTEQPPTTKQAGKHAAGLSMSVELGYCDGHDVVIEHGAKNPDDIRMERLPNDPRCADGTLTPRELDSLLK